MRDMDVKILDAVDGIAEVPEVTTAVAGLETDSETRAVEELQNDSETEVSEESKKVTRRTKK